VTAAHTGIGLISLLIAALEHNPHRPYLNPTSPLVNYLECAAEFSDGMPKGLRKAVFDLEDSLSSKRGEVDNKALEKVLDWWVEGSVADGTLPKGMGKAMVSTTQAVDIINGGVKVNALACCNPAGISNSHLYL
jgi:Gly-Xaa carboxypeptidase